MNEMWKLGLVTLAVSFGIARATAARDVLPMHCCWAWIAAQEINVVSALFVCLLIVVIII